MDEMFEKLGERGTMLRLDPDVTPKMFHFAVISEAEVALLRQIKQVYRQGRVKRIEPGAMHFANETAQVPEQTLFIDCTATAVPFEARGNVRPFFDGDTITLQLMQTPFVPYSAALAAFIEANFETDEEKKSLCPPAPLKASKDNKTYAVMTNLIRPGNLSIESRFGTVKASFSAPNCVRLPIPPFTGTIGLGYMLNGYEAARSFEKHFGDWGCERAPANAGSRSARWCAARPRSV